MGDFFEMYGHDAETAAKVLRLTLTSRDGTVAMAGFPHHCLESYLRVLLKAGHRVAICDPADDLPGGACSERIELPCQEEPPSLFAGLD